MFTATPGMFVADMQGLVLNAADFGFSPSSSASQNNTAIAAAITAITPSGGIIFVPPGTYKIATPISISAANITLAGSGAGTILQPTANFSGSQIILITADFCSVRDLTIAYANTTYSANPAADGIRITGCRSGTIFNVYLNYINGWAIHSTATASIANYWWQFVNAHAFQCASGMRIAGNTGSSFNMAHSVTNCIMDQIQNSDAYLFEDAHDVLCTNMQGSVTAGTGNTLHVKGAAAAIYVSNVDLGPAPGPATSPTILIESGANGSPKQVTFNAGIIEGGATGVTISAGTQLRVVDCDIINNGTHGINITGGDAIVIEGCLFNLNGSTAGAGRYDFQSSTANHVEVNDCYFLTPVGSLTQQTNNAVNVTAGTVVLQNDTFSGVGYNSGNIFNSFPSIIHNCPGYNPLGNFSNGAVGASPFTFPTKSTDNTVFVAGGTVSAIAIGGVATGLTAGTFRVPAQQTFTITHTGAPTTTWFGD